MLRIRPFPAIRPCPNHVARIASPPYDVVSTEEARQIGDANPLSFMHVVRPEIDFDADMNPYDDAVYERARTNFAALLDKDLLLRDSEPAMFLYRQVMNHRKQIGLVCCCHVEDYEKDVIRKHEKTRQDKEDDRTRHVLACNANTGPVFLTYRDDREINALVEQDTNARPLYHFNAPDGVTHTVWPVPDHRAYAAAFEAVPHAYVADGHHRAASAARAGAKRRAENPDHRGDEEYGYFLAALFPATQLSILPYNRVIADLNGLSPRDLIDRLSALGTVGPATSPVPKAPGSFHLYLDGHWHCLTIDPATIDRTNPVTSLDVALLQDRVLGPILRIGDPRVDPRIDFVGGIRGTKELEQRVRNGAALAISMNPTSIEQLMAVADAGLVMPPKSTWFEPKLRSGLFIHELGSAIAAAAYDRAP